MLPMSAFGPRSGLRVNTGRIVAMMPIDGRMAMYTSGCPKNQERCCQSSGDPPECGCNLSLRTRPAGMKKLVPATRSRINNTQAGKRTANANTAMTEVTNHAQVLYGILNNDIPRARKSKVVEIKFKAPSNEAIQKIAMEIAQRS